MHCWRRHCLNIFCTYVFSLKFFVRNCNFLLVFIVYSLIHSSLSADMTLPARWHFTALCRLHRLCTSSHSLCVVWAIVCVWLYVFQVPYSFPLQGSIQLRLNCLMQSSIEERGFLVRWFLISNNCWSAHKYLVSEKYLIEVFVVRNSNFFHCLMTWNFETGPHRKTSAAGTLFLILFTEEQVLLNADYIAIFHTEIC